MKKRLDFALLGVMAGLLFWLLDSIADTWFFYGDGNLIGHIFDAEPVEIWMRLVILLSLASFGMYAKIATHREDSMRKTFHESEELLRMVAANAMDAIVIIDEKGKTKFWNRAAEEMFGYSREDILGKDIKNHLIPESLRQGFSKGIAGFFGDGKKTKKRLEVAALRKDGEEMRAEISISAIRSGDSWHGIGLVRDITERKMLENHLRDLSLTDHLTGIANRRCVEKFLESEWKRGVRHGAPLSVILIDVDFFKLYNDTYGHPAGDACLKRLGEFFGNFANRPGDMAGRYGGEEFIVILADTPLDAAAEMAEKIRRGIESLKIENGDRRLTISAGAHSRIPDRDSPAETLIQTADERLYRAKREGRNRTIAD